MACKARHDPAPMKPHLHQYSSPTCPSLDALTWVPPLSMTALCTWMLSPSLHKENLHKENLHSACRCQLFHEGSPDSSSRQTTSLFVRKYFLTKYFILTFPFHYSAFTTLHDNYWLFYSHPEARGSYCFVFVPSSICLLIWLQVPSQQVFGDSICHPALGPQSVSILSAPILTLQVISKQNSL